MITEKIIMEVKTIEESPDYNKLSEKFTPIQIIKAIIVKNGMRSGGPSVDIQCQDAKGNKFLIFAKGGIISLLGDAVSAVRTPG